MATQISLRLETPRFEYFPSGTNHGAQIAALGSLGCNVGVAAHELKAGAEEALLALAGTGVLVFVDSGAFSEVEFPKNAPPVVVAPITDADWLERLGLYRRLALVLGSQLYVVAPDRVGCQATTLERMARYAPQVRELEALGANVIVPLQRGELSQIDFDAAAGEALGLAGYVRGVPLKNAATTWQDYVALMAALPAGTRIHLLGKGPNARGVKDPTNPKAPSKKFDDFLAAAAHLVVFCDSVMIRSLVGRSGGKNNGDRALTIIQDRIRAEQGWPHASVAKLQGADAYRLQYLAVREVFQTLPLLAALCRQPIQLAA